MLFLLHMSTPKHVIQYWSRSRLLLLVLVFIGPMTACRVFNPTYNVPEGKYLLKKNKITIKGEELDEAATAEIIRQQPNMKTGLRFRLMAYNMIRAEKAEKSRLKRLNKLKRKNAKRKARELKINTHRRDKAIAKAKRKAAKKGLEYDQSKVTYFKRTIPLKDTLKPRPTARERIKYKYGEAPVVADSFQFEKSKEQLRVYLNNKGLYHGSITASMDTIRKGKKGKITANYNIVTGERYYIDSLIVESDNPVVEGSFRRFIRKYNDKYDYNDRFHEFLKNGKPFKIPFDQDQLDGYRSAVAKALKDDAIYGFTAQNIRYVADTVLGSTSVKLHIVFTDRIIKSEQFPDSVIMVKHQQTLISHVYFHICDTSLFGGNFKSFYEDKFNLIIDNKNLLPTVDTFDYAQLFRKAENRDDGNDKEATFYKSAVEKNLFGKAKDSLELNPLRMATFYYNGELFVKPGLIEAQNYLEYTNPYKEYYLDRTYNRLLQLNLFSVIKPEIIEKEGGGELEVHYYLVPSRKQVFGLEPRATNSNGFLGVSATVNYTNKNLFKAGWLTTIGISGGFESQPPVFDETADGQKVQKSGRSFNTFEIGPTLKFDAPGFLPVGVTKLAKRSRPRTVLSTAYNYQRRPDFKRSVFQMNFLWKMYVGKTQIFSLGVPGVSVIKFVSITKSPEMEQRINELNDLFLRNAYSNQLIWEDFKLIYDYDNRDKDEKKTEKLRLTFNATYDMAGNILSIGRKSQVVDSTGKYTLFGVPYSQFALLDTKFIAYYNINRKNSIAFRSLLGMGIPYGNTTTSLPYDYSFFAGGANDNRGFFARALGPGSYQYYKDTNRTATQIGDIRLLTSLEYRLGGGFFKSAFFFDAGNIWTYKNDTNRVGSQFSKNWYKELALAVGYGIRLDFEYFVVRCDLGVPFTNPALPSGERWIFQKHDKYYEDVNKLSTEEQSKLNLPFAPRVNFGIGFPF